jgi:thiamine biosynthesis protein ThiS
VIITLNGESRDVAPGITVTALLEQLGVNPKVVVVQRNDEIVERIDFDATTIHDGDQVELVRFVGGG